MKKIIKTKEAPEAIGPYNQAVTANGFLFTAGQIGINPSSGLLVEGGVEKEIVRVMQNLDAILDSEGIDKTYITKLTVYVTDLSDFTIVNNAFENYFAGTDYPARSTVEVSALPLGALVEVDCIAFLF
ncbi:MAG: reactive intermediate/imine deaminase [Candidatus Marinimicrobia bacterium]|nr:reactive intermediate/imine deaminase [Candidatus Neomarinimicrobiota bacterium]|tara:strand:+ start:1152 stop:1535 length:384 start_codon:yes stop_codon:yes gene_type:complete